MIHPVQSKTVDQAVAAGYRGLTFKPSPTIPNPPSVNYYFMGVFASNYKDVSPIPVSPLVGAVDADGSFLEFGDVPF